MPLSIHYTISMPEPHTHRFHVAIEVSGYTLPDATFALPVWTPGSYLVREFARHVEGFQAERADGTPLAWKRLDKTRWQVETRGAGNFRLHYQVYAFEWSVRTSHLTSEHGYFNGTSVFMYLDGYTQHPVTLDIVPPPGRDWRVSIALPQAPDGHYVAQTYDQLADSPAEIGTHRVFHFEAFGRPHEVAVFGEGNEDAARVVADLQSIVETTASIFRDELPYERYLFILHLSDGSRGGLEHRDSTTLLVDRWTFEPRSSYERFLRLAAHEYFHTWNGKRIRPHNLGPFDYLREVYTPLLWVVEGFTTYYDRLIIRRAGLISAKRYLEMLAEQIADYRSTPGRLIQPLAEASQMAWIKHYRPDENTPNTAISYYLKGSLVALMLDMRIRHSTEGEKCLDDLMRYLWTTYGRREVGFSPDEFVDALELVAEGDYDDFVRRYVYRIDELPLEEALARAGLELSSYRKDEAVDVWLGISFEERRGEGNGLTVKQVVRDSPAERGDLNPQDELVAINGYRLKSAKMLSDRLKETEPGQPLTFHLFRNGRLLAREVVPVEGPPDAARIEHMPEVTPLQRTIYESWLHADWSRPTDKKQKREEEAIHEQ